MQSEIKELSSILRELKAVFSPEEVMNAFKKGAVKVAAKAQIKGFRPGKAPAQMVEKLYPEQVKEQTLELLVGSAVNSLYTEHRLDPVGPLETTEEQRRANAEGLKLDGTYEFATRFYIRPTIALKSYKGFTIKRPRTDVTDAEIDQEIELIRMQAGQLIPVNDRNVAALGDYASMSYEISVDGASVLDAPSKEAMHKLDQQELYPPFVEQIVGMEVGSVKEFDLAYGDDYFDEKLRGKTGHFKVTLKQLKSLDLPAVDDDLAAQAGKETLAELKEDIKAKAIKRIAQESDALIKGQIREQLIDAHQDFEIPPYMLAQQVKTYVDEFQERVRQGQVDPSQITTESTTKMMQMFNYRAQHAVRFALTLFEIVRVEKIQITEENINTFITDMANQSNVDESRVRAYFATEDRMRELEYNLLEDSVFKLIESAAQIQETTQSVAELRQALATNSADPAALSEEA